MKLKKQLINAIDNAVMHYIEPKFGPLFAGNFHDVFAKTVAESPKSWSVKSIHAQIQALAECTASAGFTVPQQHLPAILQAIDEALEQIILPKLGPTVRVAARVILVDYVNLASCNYTASEIPAQIKAFARGFANRPKVTRGEAIVIVDVCNGILRLPGRHNPLLGNIEDAAKLETMRFTGRVPDPELFVRRLRALSPSDLESLWDSSECFWHAVSNGNSKADVADYFNVCG